MKLTGLILVSRSLFSAEVPQCEWQVSCRQIVGWHSLSDVKGRDGCSLMWAGLRKTAGKGEEIYRTCAAGIDPNTCMSGPLSLVCHCTGPQVPQPLSCRYSTTNHTILSSGTMKHIRETKKKKKSSQEIFSGTVRALYSYPAVVPLVAPQSCDPSQSSCLLSPLSPFS